MVSYFERIHIILLQNMNMYYVDQLIYLELLELVARYFFVK